MIRASDLRKETRERAGPDWGLGPEKTWKLEKLALPENGLGRAGPSRQSGFAFFLKLNINCPSQILK